MQTSDHQMKTYNQTQLHDLGLQANKQDNKKYVKNNSRIIDKLGYWQLFSIYWEVIPESDTTWILAKTIILLVTKTRILEADSFSFFSSKKNFEEKFLIYLLLDN